jgi:hypothetical protein
MVIIDRFLRRHWMILLVNARPLAGMIPACLNLHAPRQVLPGNTIDLIWILPPTTSIAFICTAAQANYL